MFSPLLRRYTCNSTWLYNFRIFIALCGTAALPWWLGEAKLTIPLTLGVVAAALTDLLPLRPWSCFSPGPGCSRWA